MQKDSRWPVVIEDVVPEGEGDLPHGVVLRERDDARVGAGGGMGRESGAVYMGGKGNES